MKIAVVDRPRDPISLQVYRRSIARELEALGHQVQSVPIDGPVADDCGVVWEPSLGMQAPAGMLKRENRPIVATVHGLGGLVRPLRQCARGPKLLVLFALRRMLIRRGWRWFRRRVSAVIAPSQFGARETAEALGLPDELLHVVHHGVDRNVFAPDGPAEQRPKPYFYVVGQYQRSKNIERLLAAYAELPESTRPDLLALLPGYPPRATAPAGVTILRRLAEPADIARYLRGALAFVLPSLHETFCLPMAEAMACGCPVLAADATAMPEVAAGAALLVDPLDVEDIRRGLSRLADDDALRAELRRKGLARAEQLTWRTSAESHLKIFESVRQ